jgi:hypothetical protein
MVEGRDNGGATINCACGWRETFSRGYSGLQIQCPQCGKEWRIPTFHATAEPEYDMKTLNRLIGESPEAPAVTVHFKPLFLLSLAVGVVAVLASVALAAAGVIAWYPMAVVIAGGGLSWPLGISVAWWGQSRQVRKGTVKGTSSSG